jgi:hypothetical protein
MKNTFYVKPLEKYNSEEKNTVISEKIEHAKISFN